MRNCPLKRVNNSLRKVKYCYGNFLLVETELVMTTLISSHEKDNDCFCKIAYAIVKLQRTKTHFKVPNGGNNVI